MRTLLAVLGIIIALFIITIDEIPGLGTLNFDIPFLNIPILEGGIERQNNKGAKDPRTQISRQITNRSETVKFSLPMVMEFLDDFYADSDKLEFIETRIHSMPDSLSWAELNDILDLFFRCDDKLKVAKLLRSRIKTNYSDKDRRRFMSHFFHRKDKNEAMKILFGE